MNAMRSIVCVVAICAGVATVLAQTPMPPAPQPPPGTGTDAPPPGTGSDATSGSGSGSAIVRPIRPPDPPPIVQPPPKHDDTHRPTEFSVGIGIGYQLPTTLDTPNLTSVRLRLPTGLTLEPQLILAKSSRTVDTGMPVTDETTELGIGAIIRYPIVKRSRVDLELLGALSVDQLETIPSEPDMGTRVTTTQISYGLAVSMWMARHWQLSFTAGNALLTSVKNRQEMGVGTVTVTTNTTYGLIFDPQVQLMIHLYH
jgi:hypothetical protein